jgi:SAM-dependent methyltransferase
MNTFKRTEPWFATEEILRSYLSRARPFLTGRLLDAGCGARRYRDMFEWESYVGLELDHRHNPDVVGDLRDMPFGSDVFDAILSNQVLEHVDDIHRAFREFHRVLKPGGYLCVTVPFIARTHELPHDYWRISEYGLRYLLSRHGFQEVEILGMGGFLTTQAYLWQFGTWNLLQKTRLGRLVAKPAMVVSNYLFIAIRRVERERTTPFNYYCLARKA